MALNPQSSTIILLLWWWNHFNYHSGMLKPCQTLSFRWDPETHHHPPSKTTRNPLSSTIFHPFSMVKPVKPTILGGSKAHHPPPSTTPKAHAAGRQAEAQGIHQAADGGGHGLVVLQRLAWEMDGFYYGIHLSISFYLIVYHSISFYII